ncbi:hypothetical protein [Chromatocurvus halotolerans]|uniref:hypothetical protein n=1 Tax=Chromatocurvus halotolerans TaxID=1132028 RepID=UPI00104873D8|nr:hypothetical protein [Chromatocurvus halotolerans]
MKVLRDVKEEAGAKVAATANVVARYVDGGWLSRIEDELQPRFDFGHYHAVPGVDVVLRSVRKRYDAKAMQLVMHHLLCRLVASFDVDRLPFSLVDEVVHGYARSFSRILQLEPQQLQLNDRFMKDLALASGRLYPAAERVVEPFSVIQRSLLYSGGWRQACRFARALVEAGGNKPVFRLHVHLSEVSRFSQQSWYQTCVITAKMAEANPAIRGVVGGSWFYDPDISAVSPRLAFIANTIADGGAGFYFSHAEDYQSGALSMSKRRREAFENGLYIPRNFALFWPRRSLINWSRRQPEYS